MWLIEWVLSSEVGNQKPCIIAWAGGRKGVDCCELSTDRVYNLGRGALHGSPPRGRSKLGVSSLTQAVGVSCNSPRLRSIRDLANKARLTLLLLCPCAASTCSSPQPLQLHWAGCEACLALACAFRSRFFCCLAFARSSFSTCCCSSMPSVAPLMPHFHLLFLLQLLWPLFMPKLS